MSDAVTTTEVAVRQQNPMARFCSDLKTQLESRKTTLSDMVPAGIDANRYVRTALLFASKVDKIDSCTMSSVVRAIMQGAALGLDFSLQECYLIPYKSECAFSADYKGLMRLAMQSPDVRDIQAHCVYESDVFEWELDKIPHHKCQPFSGNRGKIIGSYAYAVLKDGHVQCITMSIKEIEAARSQSRNPNSLMWSKFYSEGAKKVVLRRMMKTIPKSTALSQALAVDDAAEFPTEAPKIAPKRTAADRLLEKLEDDKEEAIVDENVFESKESLEAK